MGFLNGSLGDLARIDKKASTSVGYAVSDFVDWLEDRATEEIAKRPKDARGE